MSQNRAFLLLRYTLIAATGYLLLVEESFALPRTEVLWILAGALLSNLALTFLPARLVGAPLFAGSVILVDTAWVTATLILSGRFASEFFYLYFFVLLLAAVGERLSLIATAALLLCGFYVVGHIAAGGSWSMWTSPSLIRLPFLFAAAVFYGHLVDCTRRQRRRADTQEELARQLERTLEELRAAHAKAEESDRVKSTFLATVSHELRTPLVAIIGYVDLLLEGVYGRLTNEQEEVVTRLQMAGTNLYQLVAGVLDASRLDLGAEAVEVRECSLADVLGDLRAEFSDRGSVRVYFPHHLDVPAIVTDEAKLRRILANLLDNAVRYTERGVVTVDARWDPARDRVEVRVSDTGPGIAAEDLENVFQAFRQGSGRPHSSAGGIGLGLYVARRTAELLGGELTLASTLGEGSTFTVSVPRQLLGLGERSVRTGSLATH